MTLHIPQAQRLKRPSWRDGRLLVGVLLILMSVALGARIMAAADRTVPVYAAAGSLVPGEKITQDRLVRISVALGEADKTYLPANEPLPEDAVVVREVRRGELVPAAALTSGSQATRTSVMIPASAESAQVLTVGSVVDIWINEKKPGSGTAHFGTPRKVVNSAPVARMPRDGEGRFSGVNTVGVQVQVPNGDVQRLIEAMDQGARITLVPAAGSAQRAD